MHPQVVRELANVTARLRSIIFERLEQSGEDTENWKKVNATPFFKDKNENPGNLRQASLTLDSGKMMELILTGTIFKCMKEKKATGSSEHRFMKRNHA